MKPKKIPRVVKAWLLLLGIWGGSTFGMALTAFAFIGCMHAWFALAGLICGSMALIFLIEWRYKETLNAWGIGTPATQLTKKVGKKL